jgi:hypothetical protein
MSIPISAFGVRGDMQPYLALAVGLQAALGEKIRAQDGVARAAEIVERQVGTRMREGWNTNARRGAKVGTRSGKLEHECAKAGTRTREGAQRRETRRHGILRRAPPFAFFMLRVFENLREFVFQTPPETLFVTSSGRLSVTITPWPPPNTATSTASPDRSPGCCWA